MNRLVSHGFFYYTLPGIVLTLGFDQPLIGLIFCAVGALHLFLADVIEEVKR